MNKKNIYIFIVVLLIVGFITLFYYLGIFSGKDSSEVEGVFGKVMSNNLDNEVLVVESNENKTFDVALVDNTRIFDLYNSKIEQDSIKENYLVNVEGDIKEDDSVIASKIKIADTDSDMEISAYDKNKTFTYSQGSKFKVIFNDTLYPFYNLECTPSGVVNNISDSPGANPPYYAAEFEAVNTGQCVLKNGDFSADIEIEE